MFGAAFHLIFALIVKNDQVEQQEAEMTALNNSEGEDAPIEDEIAKADGVFFSNEVISGQEVDEILRSSLTRLIVIAGSPNSGKTTLIASLFDAFNQSPFADFLFARSDTMGGFERRSFTARLTSERTLPTTERTIPEETIRFLQISARDMQLDQPAQQMLFADISGEMYQHAQVNTEDVQMLRFIERADHFVVMIDGGKLNDVALRQTEKAAAYLIIRSLLDEGILKPDAFVDVLFSRWDKVAGSPDAKGTKDFVAHVKEELANEFAHRVGRLKFYEVAARPDPRVLPIEYNLAEVFQDWVRASPLSERSWHTHPTIPMTLSEVIEDRNARKLG